MAAVHTPSSPDPFEFSQPPAAALAQALGLPLFESPWHMSQYPEGAVGRWRMQRGRVGLDRGYHSGPCVAADSAVLLRQAAGDRWETWMSLSPFEIESQELACRHAHGDTVVMGLGMGWTAANMALQPAVRKVTVVERDAEVLELFDQCQVLAGLPASAASKFDLVQADALEWRPPMGTPAIDFLFADIWLDIAEPRTLADVQRMQSNVRAQQVYFWGQELVLGALARQQAQPSDGLCWTQALSPRCCSCAKGPRLCLEGGGLRKNSLQAVDEIVKTIYINFHRGCNRSLHIQTDRPSHQD